jgi:hypothetical protein
VKIVQRQAPNKRNPCAQRVEIAKRMEIAKRVEIATTNQEKSVRKESGDSKEMRLVVVGGHVHTPGVIHLLFDVDAFVNPLVRNRIPGWPQHSS